LNPKITGECLCQTDKASISLPKSPHMLASEMMDSRSYDQHFASIRQSGEKSSVLESVWPVLLSLIEDSHALISLAKSCHALARPIMYRRVSGQHQPT